MSSISSDNNNLVNLRYFKNHDEHSTLTSTDKNTNLQHKEKIKTRNDNKLSISEKSIEERQLELENSIKKGHRIYFSDIEELYGKII